MNGALYVGLMSGTSVDAIDSALVRCAGPDTELLATHEHPIPEQTRHRIASLSQPGADEIERMGALDRELGTLFAAATNELLSSSSTKASEVRAIGSHGQTIRHRPPSAPGDGTDYFTLQIGDPNTIAELTGISTVADFRRRDVAAGGEGAPLAPAFHAAAFAHSNVTRAIVNIGGIANISILQGKDLLEGYDSGPGNTLLDHWIERQRGLPYDRDGAWSAEGRLIEGLLNRLLSHPYFALRGPRSTGKEAFNLAWLDGILSGFENAKAIDIQATLAEFTATTIASAIDTDESGVSEVFVCGGGAHNTDLMRRLYRKLDPVSLDTTRALGLDPDWVEAVTFAWLAHRTIEGLAGNAPAVTGAGGFRVLGGIYQA